jgi:hypothetical protein
LFDKSLEDGEKGLVLCLLLPSVFSFKHYMIIIITVIITEGRRRCKTKRHISSQTNKGEEKTLSTIEIQKDNTELANLQMDLLPFFLSKEQELGIYI